MEKSSENQQRVKLIMEKEAMEVKSDVVQESRDDSFHDQIQSTT